MAGRRRRSSGSDYTSDEEFELGASDACDVSSEDVEMEDSDAFSDAVGSAGSSSSGGDGAAANSEVEDDDEDYEEDEDEDDADGEFVVEDPSSRKRPPAALGPRKRRRRLGARRKEEDEDEAEYEEEEEDEDGDEEVEEEYEDESDKDFSPDEEEEKVLRISARKGIAGRRKAARGRGRGGRRSISRIVDLVDEDEDGEERRKCGRPLKTRGCGRPKKGRRRRKTADDSAPAKRKKSKRRATKGAIGAVKRRGRTKVTSDDEDDADFLVEEDPVPVTQRGGRGGNWGKSIRGRRRLDGSDSDSSDFECSSAHGHLLFLPFVGANCKRRRTERVPEKEKGKGKEVDESGRQVCGICLCEEHRGVARGLLDSCAHFFCFACILEWSKVESRCPVCKQRFVTISKVISSNTILGMRPTVVRVPKRDQVYQPSEEELWGFLNPYENVVCMECLQGGDDHLMLLCDLCDSPAHTYCVGLGRDVPEGDWYCNGCRSTHTGQFRSPIQDPEDLRILNNGLSREQHSINNGNSVNGGPLYAVPDRGHFHATPDRMAPMHEILEQSAPRGLDLNLPMQIPSAETNVIARASGPSALTLSGRRALSQRIRILLSDPNSRSRLATPQSPATTIAQLGSVEVDSADSGQRRQTALHSDLIPDSNGRQRRSVPCRSYEESHL